MVKVGRGSLNFIQSIRPSCAEKPNTVKKRTGGERGQHTGAAVIPTTQQRIDDADWRDRT